MIEFNLTGVTIDYLLYFIDFKTDHTITKVAKNFNCSKANSKKILDRMVFLGLLYKEENNYNLTGIGEHFASIYKKKRDNAVMLLKEVYKLRDKDEIDECAKELLRPKLMRLSDIVDEKVEVFSKLKKVGPVVKSEELSEILPKKLIDMSYGIYKLKPKSDDFLTEKSMASMGFEDQIFLNLEENEKAIYLTSRSVKRNDKGYCKEGIARKLIYVEKGEEKEIIPVNRIFKIPFHSIRKWNYLGNGILQTASVFTIIAAIGFNNHVEKANFVFTINLHKV